MTMTVIGGGIVLTEESVLMMSTVFTKRSASPSHLCICVYVDLFVLMYLCSRICVDVFVLMKPNVFYQPASRAQFV